MNTHRRAALTWLLLLPYCGLLFFLSRVFYWFALPDFSHLSLATTWPVMFLNVVILSSFSVGASSLLGSVPAGALSVAGGLALFNLANIKKYALVQTFIAPSDLLVAWEFLRIPGHYVSWPEMAGILAASVVILAAGARLLKRGPRLSRRARIIAAMVTSAVLAPVLMFRAAEWDYLLEHIGSNLVDWSEVADVKRNGVLVHTLSRLHPLAIPVPRRYSQSEVRELVANLPFETRSAKASPDLVVIMLEAFADPKDYDIPLKRDPIPFFHSLQRTASSGKLVVPVYGGGTCNTEFEVLTGCPTSFFPDPLAYAFEWYVKRAIHALPAQLSEQGYVTRAVHPNEGTFWHRNVVYPLLGFQYFDDIEAFRFAPTTRGRWTSDLALVNHVAETGEDDQENRLFTFAISVASHSPYESPPVHEFRYVRDQRSELGVFEGYLRAIAETDSALRDLIRYYSNSRKETLVVLFGDHHPALGQAVMGFDLAPFETPLAVWSNFPRRREELGKIAAYFLGAKLMRELGLGTSPPLQLGSQLADELRATFGNAALPEIGPAPARVIALMKDLKLLQYDELFGKQWARN